LERQRKILKLHIKTGNMSHCQNINYFSEAVYSFLSRVFRYQLSFSEIGLTDHLILNIAEYSNAHSLNNVEIFKIPWTIESVYGNDIDLFIQNASGKFNWYALQAKVMSYNGSFRDLKNRSAVIGQQWDKLLDHEIDFGSKTYYLFYSGKSLRPPNGLPTRNDCIGIPKIEELGLGIVDTSVIKNLREHVLTPYGFLYFKHIFPDHVDSLRKLFCCIDNLPKTPQQFTRSQIDTTGYQKIFFNESVSIIEENEDYEGENEKKSKGSAPIRIIIRNEY
jgi:hypothetical protein